jgi:hypothetical protein
MFLSAYATAARVVWHARTHCVPLIELALQQRAPRHAA